MESVSSVTAISVSSILITNNGETYNSAAREAERREITRLPESLDLSALLSRASYLRNGIPCSLPQPLLYDRSTRSSVMGGMNYQIEILFDDGVRWLARIRRFNATSPPPDLRDYIMRSEVATLQFLSKTKVSAPKIFDYGLHGQTPIGVGYILMGKLPGKSLRCWQIYTLNWNHSPFDNMGSLDRLGTDYIGPFARESLTHYISNYRDHLRASIELNMDLIMIGESYARREIDAFLVHRFLLDCIPEVLLYHSFDDGLFYLRHADDKGDHILIDDDYNITRIVDWEWAYTESKSAAFKSPIMLLPVADFYNGVNCIGEDEVPFANILEQKGHKGLAEIVRNGRLLHRFQFCCRYDFADWEGFLGLFQGLRNTLNKDADLSWEEWKQKALERYSGDEQLETLLARTD
ncbi:hypothetical protein BDV24DRAFT_149485 [Aspergillus arachidicola]|uniref:Aminoglycoside phosphotransferase domain-containing protein n=1 Tax=Aspergillus arachidicola TaxID=656916 RepID=A0A5N6YDJ6_9EURO|nr:hypothetical protein BDV24DRAFT_149485 [Aspergillus arachidicola]